MNKKTTHKNMGIKDLEKKILVKYNKVNPKPQTLEERVQEELNKLNK